MVPLKSIGSVTDLYYGRDPYLDAWLLHFMTENDIEYYANPLENASPEQMRFMVDLDEDQIFAPCSDEMLKKLLFSQRSRAIKEEYSLLWKRMLRLIQRLVHNDYTKKKIITLCKHKFTKAYKSPFLIPSRLNKRMLTIVLSQMAQHDPYENRKAHFNIQAHKFTTTDTFEEFINPTYLSPAEGKRLRELRHELNVLELKKLFCLSLCHGIWREGKKEVAPQVQKGLKNFEKILAQGVAHSQEELTILYLPNSSGGLIFDLLIIKQLIKMGHRVILALKGGFYFDYPTFWEIEESKILEKYIEHGRIIKEKSISKKQLLKELNQHHLVIISDGSRERLNLYRTSVTFARAWKESDLIIAKGHGNYRRLILNSHQFTRDIIAIFRDEGGEVHYRFKPKSVRVRKITEKEIIAKAKEIIEDMKKARAQGQKVMFYSAIVGSIPGETQRAIKILTTFVNYLRQKLEGVFIINPAEHFEEGMDGDDLMYMWEIVQRSGLIDVWRFQTVADIEKSFELMGEKIPPIWAGKDATFSTGCTQEMKIALEEQKKHPEMQIIGPDPEKFFRRREYGVGKYFDAALNR